MTWLPPEPTGKSLGVRLAAALPPLDAGDARSSFAEPLAGDGALRVPPAPLENAANANRLSPVGGHKAKRACAHPGGRSEPEVSS